MIDEILGWYRTDTAQKTFADTSQIMKVDKVVAAVTEKDLEQIWNKWTNVKTPPEAENKCQQAVEPLEEFFGELAVSHLRSLNSKQLRELGEYTGSVVARMCRACFMVGLEYGARSNVPHEVSGLLQLAAEPVGKLGAQLIGLAVNTGVSE